MNESQLLSIIKDFRAGYQIPPYIEHEHIERLAKEALGFLKILKPNLDPDDDVTRGLILARMFYGYNHQEMAFTYDYIHDITTWQMEEVEAVE